MGMDYISTPVEGCPVCGGQTTIKTSMYERMFFRNVVYVDGVLCAKIPELVKVLKNLSCSC